MPSIHKQLVSIACFFLPSGISRILFRLVGHRVGKNTKLPIFSYIYADRLEIGNDVDIRPFVFIRVSECVIGNNSIVSFGCQIVGAKGFSTKDNCFIGPHCILHCDENIAFGFYSGLGARCTIYSHGSFLPVNMGYPVKFADVTIEDYVWAGIGAIFLPGSYVESSCIINAGVVVTGRIRSGTLLQIDQKRFQTIDLGKVVRFSRRDNRYYHQMFVTTFLSDMKIGFSNPSSIDTFRTDNGYLFESHASTNEIALRVPGVREPITYDLEKFYCSYSSDALHKEFLRFLRRRFGVNLRTSYDLAPAKRIP